MDVFYHTVIERGVTEAISCLLKILNSTKRCLIFAPGRWDKLSAANCTQEILFNFLISNSVKIKYLGKDDDEGYNREIYSVYR
jgi:hypothetical protein